MEKLKDIYFNYVVPSLIKEFGYYNNSEVPIIKKIVINRSFNESCQTSKILDYLLFDMGLITGQKGVLVRSKVSIANFKLKENMPVGMFVTLRGKRMYFFLERFINIALPRIRDFQGVSKSSFDSRGNFSLGLSEQIMFPEIEFDKVIKLKGLDIVIVTSAKTKKEAYYLLKGLGFPFQKL